MKIHQLRPKICSGEPQNVDVTEGTRHTLSWRAWMPLAVTSRALWTSGRERKASGWEKGDEKTIRLVWWVSHIQDFILIQDFKVNFPIFCASNFTEVSQLPCLIGASNTWQNYKLLTWKSLVKLQPLGMVPLRKTSFLWHREGIVIHPDDMLGCVIIYYSDYCYLLCLFRCGYLITAIHVCARAFKMVIILRLYGDLSQRWLLNKNNYINKYIIHE
jgi:hypothetical protein